MGEGLLFFFFRNLYGEGSLVNVVVSASTTLYQEDGSHVCWGPGSVARSAAHLGVVGRAVYLVSV